MRKGSRRGCSVPRTPAWLHQGSLACVGILNQPPVGAGRAKDRLRKWGFPLKDMRCECGGGQAPHARCRAQSCPSALAGENTVGVAQCRARGLWS